MPRETQKTVGEWGVKTFPGQNNLYGRIAAILEEAVELAVASGMSEEDLFNITGQAAAKSMRQETHDLQEEAADVLSCIYALAHLEGFDVHLALDHKMELCRARPQSYYDAKTQAKVDAGMRIIHADPSH